MTDRQRRGRHRRKRPPNAALVGVTSAIVATSIAAGAGAAYAVPEQGGTTPQGDGQEQGGTAPDTTGTRGYGADRTDRGSRAGFDSCTSAGSAEPAVCATAIP